MDVEYQLIKKNDVFCSNEEQLISLLRANKCYDINIKNRMITYKNILINYSIRKCETVNKDNIIFMIKFSASNEDNLDILEKFDKSFFDFIKRFVSDISLNILHDDISKYYADNMYLQIFDVENLLRKVIYCFMGRNVGKDWIQKCFPKDVTDSIKEVYKKSENENNENILYSVDFIQLEKILFLKYPLKYIKQEQFINSLIEEDSKIKEIISDYEYKSNWDRYFSEVVSKDELDENLSELYKYRILVAHNKKIRKEDMNKTKKLINKINKKLEECLSKIEKIEVPEEKKEALKNMSTRILNSYNDLACNKYSEKLNLMIDKAGNIKLNDFNYIFPGNEAIQLDTRANWSPLSIKASHLDMNSEIFCKEDSAKLKLGSNYDFRYDSSSDYIKPQKINLDISKIDSNENN